jgi:putative Mg2+ transporter-C (MgtC) family protein
VPRHLLSHPARLITVFDSDDSDWFLLCDNRILPKAGGAIASWRMILGAFDFWDSSIQQFMASLGWPTEALARLLLAAVAGGLVGLEREVRGRQAGFRTYLLVCVGSALTMLVSSQLALHDWQPANTLYTVRVDPGRIAYGVMTGIGFLGAGVIVRHTGGTVRGLTTAAGLWCVAAIGLGIGFGMYVVAAMGTLIVLAALWILDYVEDAIPKLRYRMVVVRTKYTPGVVAKTVKRFKSGRLHVSDVSFDRSEDLQHALIKLQIAFINSDQYYDLERQLEADPEYHLVSTNEI